MGKIKIKHRNPKRTEFTPNDIVINVKNGTLFYKSNFAIFRLQGVQTTLINPAADTVSVNIEQAEHQQVLFNNNSVMDGSENFKYEFTDDGTGVLSNEKLVLGTDMDVDGVFKSAGGINITHQSTAATTAGVSLSTTTGGLLSVRTPAGHCQIGPKTSDYSHFSTNIAGGFKFNNKISVDSGQISSFNEDLNLFVDKFDIDKTKIRLANTNAQCLIEMFGNLSVKAHGSANGKIAADNDIIAFASDKRLKENIIEISNPLDKIKQIRGIYYDWKENVKEKGFYPNRKKNEIGMIAQEVEKIIPQAIEPAPFNNDYKTIKYDRIIPLLVECIKDQQKQIDELKNKLDGYL